MEMLIFVHALFADGRVSKAEEVDENEKILRKKWRTSIGFARRRGLLFS